MHQSTNSDDLSMLEIINDLDSLCLSVFNNISMLKTCYLHNEKKENFRFL